MDSQWYKDALIYELDVRSFYDSDHDGLGDFRGLADKLDYLQELGVTALVLGPSRPGPHRDDGHGVGEDHSVYPGGGTAQDLERFLGQAHAHGMRVVMDLVASHTSDPALSVDEPRLRRAVLKILRDWLDMGVDGVRLDGMRHLAEREGLSCEKLPETHEIVKELRKLIDQHYPDCVLLADTNQPTEDLAAYFGDGDECHLAFNVSLMPRLLMAFNQENRRPVADVLRRWPEIPTSCQWALSLRSRDNLSLKQPTNFERGHMHEAYPSELRFGLKEGICRRPAPLVENDRRRIELAYGLLFTLPGSPIVYYGNEIGMGDNIYLSDCKGMRTPMQWSGDRNAGFSRANPARLHIPVNADPVYGYQSLNVEAQKRQPFSLLNWMRRLIAVRKQHQTFGRGRIEFLEPRNQKVLAYVRRYGDERILVVANLSGKAQSVELLLGLYAGAQPVEMLGGTSFRRIGGGPYSLALPPYGFYWFTLSRQATRATGPSDIGATVSGNRGEAVAAPAIPA